MDDMRDGALTIEVSPDGTIVVGGDIDMASGPRLEAELMEQEGDQPLVLDLSGVEFIDSSGLRVLFDANRRAAERGTEVVLRAVGPEVTRLLEITGTTSRFRIDTSG